MKSRTWYWVVGGVVVLGLLSYLYLSTHEYREETVWEGKSAAARVDPYLAASQFLTRMGMPCEGRSSLGELPGTDEVILLAGDRTTLIGSRLFDLLDWVEDGGRLVVVVRPEEDPRDEWWDPGDLLTDDLLDMFGISVYLGDRSHLDRELEESDVFQDELPDTTEPIDLAIKGTYSVGSGDASNYTILDDEKRVVLLEVSRSLGKVVALADAEWMDNDHLDLHHHATLLWFLAERMAGPRTADSRMVIVRRDVVPGFLSILWREANFAIIAAMVLCGVWVWRVSRRVGPVFPDATTERRRLEEHLVAAGRFLWKHHARTELLQPIREHLHRQLVRRRPALGSLPRQELVEQLSELSDLAASRVRLAMYAERVSDAREFVTAVQDLQRLESKL